MARRDNQGIQIAMIVFILTTLVFLGTTVFFYNTATGLKGELTKANSDLSSAQSEVRAVETLATNLKTWVGVDAQGDDSTTTTAVQEMVTKTYGQGLPEENQNFSDILEKMTNRISTLSSNLGDANKQVTDLRGQLASEQETFKGSLANAKQLRLKAEEDMSSLTEQWQAFKSSKESREGSLLSERDDAKTKMAQAIQQATKDVATAQDRERLVNSLLQMKADELNVIKRDTPDHYDGRVLGVVPATGTVLLGVGQADGVRPKTTFTVYDADDTNVRTAKKKASIEVTKVLGPHRAEAKITDTDYLSPIISNDYIYSPIWSPGSRLGLALVGKMDIDGDGSDDREYIRNLVELNGGQIDAEDVPGGKQTSGELSVNTRYIVVGEASRDGQTGGMENMLREARDFAIERMSVDELLDLMGYAGRARSLSFQGVLAPGDFAPKPRNEVTVPSTGSTSFRKRTPTPLRNRPRSSY